MRGVVALLGLVIGAGCGNERARRPPPEPPGPPAGALAGSGSGSASSDPTPPPQPSRVKLPRTPNTPPQRTSRPLDRKQVERLAAIEFEDFTLQELGMTERAAEFRHTTKTRPYLGVTVTIEPCEQRRPAARKPAAGRPCTPMDLAQWKAKTDELKQSLSKQLINRPDTRFDVGMHEVLGAPAIYTYQLGAFFGEDDNGQPVGSYSDAYILYYNDGVNQIRVNACYVDDAIGGVDKLLAVAPREDLEKLAVAFMSFYLHEWSPEGGHQGSHQGR